MYCLLLQFSLVISETSINVHIQRETTSDDDGIIRQSADEGRGSNVVKTDSFNTFDRI